MNFDDDAELAFYNKELIALSGQAAAPHRLDRPDYAARAVSPICGSEVEIELKVDNGKIFAVGFDVDACALTRSVVAVMKKAAIGKTREEIKQAGADLEAMLQGKNTFPSGDWQTLKILAPVKDYTARHNAILLPFEAVEKAFSK